MYTTSADVATRSGGRPALASCQHRHHHVSKPGAEQTASPSAGRRLLLLDGHSLAYRAFFGLPAENFRTGTGRTTNARGAPQPGH